MADSKYDKQLREMLACAGATLVRNKKHVVYKLPNGQTIPMSQTPSDWRASRKRITTLKHALATKAEVKDTTAALPIKDKSAPRKRLRIPNRPTRGSLAPVQLPKLEPFPKPPEGAVFTPFGSMWELRQHLSEMDDFWALTPSGRARVLFKSLPPGIYAEAAPMMFCRGTILEAEEFEEIIEGQNSEDRVRFFGRLMARMHYTCGNGYYPALYLPDPEEGDLLVDVTSLSMLVNVWEAVQILDVQSSSGLMITYSEVWNDRVEDEPNEVDFIFAFTPKAAKEHNVNFMTDEGWTNPAAIRHVVQALRERHNPDFMPRSRPVVKEALTPFEQFQKTMMPAIATQTDPRAYLSETNWLVTTLVTNPVDPLGNADALDWVGRVLAYSFVHQGRTMGRRLDDDTVELWFSFLNDEDKKAFLQEIRDDGYSDPNADDVAGFRKPDSLAGLKQLRGAPLVFDSDQQARIRAASDAMPNLRAAMLDMVEDWKEQGLSDAYE